MVKNSLLFLISILLCSCASSRFDTTDVDLNITPKQAIDNGTTGEQVLWGGVILSAENLKDFTQLEVLAYPLDSWHQPDIFQAAQGRFFAIQPGFMEVANLQSGREITIKGQLQSPIEGSLGEQSYTYPAIIIKQHHLWRKRSRESDDHLHFGIGVIFGR